MGTNPSLDRFQAQPKWGISDNSPMSENSLTHRGDLMRRIAALHVRVDLLGHDGKSIDRKSAEREELKRQIAALTKQMMAP
jgi:hypothetical protein